MKVGSRGVLFLATIMMGGAASASEPVPDKPGWSGYVTMGLAGLNAKTNKAEARWRAL